MEIKTVSVDDLKTLEDYFVSLGTCLLSLKTIELFQIKALEIGILDDAETQHALNLIQQLRNVFQVYKKQMDTIAERIPENISIKDIANHLLKK